MKEAGSLALWTCLFLAFELPAALWPGCPWYTLSRTVWTGEALWPAGVGVIVAVFLVVLGGHLELHWSARYLIAVAAAAAAVIASRVLEHLV